MDDACLFLMQAMSSCVGWLLAPDDFLGINHKYGSLTIECRGPRPKQPATSPTKRVLKEYPRKLHRQEEQMIFSAKGNYSPISVSRQAGRDPTLAVLIIS
ncbi:hypothetical protein PIB30_023306 [Stylosanthes scabra]|uniref:Uncharacterized protein n=1 Tax=Stylosanthes scabra TaxID=79078 RepID=A0ABU6R9W5_9FABA|nr:hypothetical protein [Stylosanthes scabra]